MAEDSEERGLLAWIKGLALPIASLIASGAFFAIQMQQQAFERKLANIESGYRFYFDQRTRLQTSDDVNTEKALLQMIGSAFPNVYCYVRSDLYARATAAENLRNTPGADPTLIGFGEDDRALLVSFIVANPAPSRAEFSTEFGDMLAFGREPTPAPCSADFDVENPVEPPAPVEETPAADPGAMVAETEAPVAADAAPAAPAPGGEPQVARSERAAGSGPAVLRAEVNAGEAPRVRLPARSFALRSETYQVFFHIVEGGARDTSVADPFRAQLAQANFRVMRGVEAVPRERFARNPVVRYYGADQAAAAGELAAFLNEQFAGEGLTFETVAIGEQYPTMPRTHLEVWVPEPR